MLFASMFKLLLTKAKWMWVFFSSHCRMASDHRRARCRDETMASEKQKGEIDRICLLSPPMSSFRQLAKEVPHFSRVHRRLSISLSCARTTNWQFKRTCRRMKIEKKSKQQSMNDKRSIENGVDNRRISECMYACTYSCTYIRTNIHTYIHT
jgi:hypothetical protein